MARSVLSNTEKHHGGSITYLYAFHRTVIESFKKLIKKLALAHRTSQAGGRHILSHEKKHRQVFFLKSNVFLVWLYSCSTKVKYKFKCKNSYKYKHRQNLNEWTSNQWINEQQQYKTMFCMTLMFLYFGYRKDKFSLCRSSMKRTQNVGVQLSSLPGSFLGRKH